MDPLLTEPEVRVLGSLIEKAITTPDQYPLSLNALKNACNQISNREPVVAYDEGTVASTIDALRHRSLVRSVQGSEARVAKYRHLTFEALGVDGRELAVMCVLMLRGPQTVGEIKTRTARLTTFETLADVDGTLSGLISRQPTPLVVRLPRRPGQKEVRYAHLLCGSVEFDRPDAVPEATAATTSAPMGDVDRDRLGALEATVDELRQEVVDLRTALAALSHRIAT